MRLFTGPPGYVTDPRELLPSCLDAHHRVGRPAPGERRRDAALGKIERLTGR